MFHLNTAKTTIEHVGERVLPTIGIHTLAFMKMKAYVSESFQEIAWLGVVETVEGGYEITDVFMCEQVAAATTVDIDEAALSEYGSNLVMTGQIDLYNKIKMWGHSHVNMAVFASGTDEATYKMFYENADFFIRLICNKKDEITVDFMDCVNGIRFLNIPWYEVKSPEQLQLEELWAAFNKQQSELYTKIVAEAKVEIKECVKTRQYVTYAKGYEPKEYGKGQGDRFVTIDRREEKKTEEKEKEKTVTKVDERADYEEKKTTLGVSLLSLPDVLTKNGKMVCEMHASTIWDSVEEVRDLMEEVFSAYDLASKCCMIEDFADYDTPDWFILYDQLWDWYYDHYMDDDTAIIK